MKKEIIGIIASILVVIPAQSAEILAHWTFNSDPPDAFLPSGSLVPVQGRGSIQLVGGVTGRFSAGDPSLPSENNSSLGTTSYPTEFTGNKTAGVQFNVNTFGFYNIVVSLRFSGTEVASSSAVLQYSADGTNFVDSSLMYWYPTNGFTPHGASFPTIRGAENNPLFALRVVTLFGSNLGGDPGPPRYKTHGRYPYSPLGSLWFDEIIVTGLAFHSDSPPTILMEPSLVTAPNTPLSHIPVMLTDTNGPSEQIQLAVQSSNERLLPQANIMVTGTSTNREIHLVPAPNELGVTMLYVTATGPRGRFHTKKVRLEVRHPNPSVVIAPIPDQATPMNTPLVIPLNLLGFDESLEPLHFQGLASYSTLVPPTHFFFSGAGTNRFLNLIPATNVFGMSRVALVVTDKFHRRTTNEFLLLVKPPVEMQICEPFEYWGGSLVTNSGGFWKTHSGADGQIPIIEGQPVLASNASEDVHVLLPGGPITAQSGTVLYAGLSIALDQLPSAAGQYFAHFNHSTFRGRIFLGSSNANNGTFQVGIANNSTTVAWVPLDLDVERFYRLVVRYNVATGQSALWVNPRSETDPATLATDAPSPISIVSYSLRESSGMGRVVVDDLKIGTSFDYVAPGFPPRLGVQPIGREAEISWPVNLVGYVIEWADTLPATNWTTLFGEPPRGYTRRLLYENPTGAAPMRFYRLRATNDPPLAIPQPAPSTF